MAAFSESQQNNSSVHSRDGLYSPPPLTSASYPDPCGNSALFATSAISVVVASCYAILIPLTVLGNGSVIAAFALNTRLRTATNIFIIGLAASDMLVGTFAIPVWTFIVSHDNIIAGYCFSVYKVYISFDIFAGCASILQLTAIALERFVSAQWPLFHRKLPQYVYCTMLLFAWIFATAMAVLQPLQAKSAIWQKNYTVVLFVLCFCIPLVIIITCYCHIFKITRFQARRRLSSCSNSRCCGSTPGVAIKELNVAITVAVITGLFLAAWFPFFVVTVIATFCLTCLPSGYALLHLVKFLKFLQYSSSAINPYVYAYRNKEMRRTFANSARNIFPCINPVPDFRTRNLSISKRDSKRSLPSMDEMRAEGYRSMSKNQDISSELEEEIKAKKHRRELPRKDKKKTAVILV